MVSPCTLFLSLFHSHFFFNRYRIIDTYRYTTTNRYTTITTYTYRYIYFISRIIFSVLCLICSCMLWHKISCFGVLAHSLLCSGML